MQKNPNNPHEPDLNHEQFKRPTGEEGRNVLIGMNEHHAELSEWALSKIPCSTCNNILDIGCGGGMLISKLGKKYPRSKICGIDISDVSVRLTEEYNSDLIACGRCTVTEGSVSDIPFDNGKFDLITAFETYFFWPDLDNDVAEAITKLAPGGYFVIVSETYPHPDFEKRNTEFIKLFDLKLRENDDMVHLLEKNGLHTECIEIVEKNWVVFIGRRS